MGRDACNDLLIGKIKGPPARLTCISDKGSRIMRLVFENLQLVMRFHLESVSSVSPSKLEATEAQF